MIYDHLQQLAILNPEAEENHAASLFANNDDVELQEMWTMTLTRFPELNFLAQHSSMSSHYLVPPTTDSDHDMAMPDADADSDEPEANLQSNHHQ
jgi:hypothetical protein